MFRHVGIVVKDMSHQREFYEKLLGMEVYYDKVEEGDFINKIVGIEASAHILKMGKNGNTIVELLNWNIKTIESDKKLLFNNGLTHFALTVDNIYETYELMLKNDIIFISAPKINDENTAIVAFCKDYEENFIELVQVIDNIK